MLRTIAAAALATAAVPAAAQAVWDARDIGGRGADEAIRNPTRRFRSFR